MFLFELTASIVKPVFLDLRPQPCKLHEVSLDSPFAIRDPPKMKRHWIYRYRGNQELELKVRSIFRPL